MSVGTKPMIVPGSLSAPLEDDVVQVDQPWLRQRPDHVRAGAKVVSKRSIGDVGAIGRSPRWWASTPWLEKQLEGRREDLLPYLAVRRSSLFRPASLLRTQLSRGSIHNSAAR